MLTELDLMQGIQDATRILTRARLDLSGGTLSLWLLLSHAEEYLDKQMVLLLAPDLEAFSK